MATDIMTNDSVGKLAGLFDGFPTMSADLLGCLMASRQCRQACCVVGCVPDGVGRLAVRFESFSPLW